MKATFSSEPENDFQEFIAAYYQACRELIPSIQSIVGKWNFEDLIPGLSDFDTRFIYSNAVTAEGWIPISEAIGDVHTRLCTSNPHWARKLEHPPGVNVTWDELSDARTYLPEALQWSPYYGDSERFAARRASLLSRGWSELDELYHLRRFISYFGPYRRGIDPPINIGEYENKYALHSRIMHYFLPPLQSAIALIERQHIRGKLETLSLAARIVPELKALREIHALLDCHYEDERYLEEAALGRLEDTLYGDLLTLYHHVRDAAKLVILPVDGDTTHVKDELRHLPINLPSQIMDSLRFARTVKGRLKFYAKDIPHFDSDWLIDNEIGRMTALFVATPLSKCWQHLSGEASDNVEYLIDVMTGSVFDRRDAVIVQRFVRQTAEPYKPEERKTRALAIAEEFDEFYQSIMKVMHAALHPR